jgi:uncharacterized OB-fold protein
MDRPQPRVPEPDTEPFWEATKKHELTYQQCDACSTVVFFPRSHCTKCGGRALTWKTSKGEGTVYTFSVVRLNRHPAFVNLGGLRRRLRRPGRGLPDRRTSSAWRTRRRT